MDFNQTRMFVEVVRAGGFTAAARRLGLPKSTVSARVQALEARLGAQLLKRSTRRLALTSEGQAYFDAVAGAVDALVDAEAVAQSDDGVLSGRIRFSAPLEFPGEALTEALQSFLELHPGIGFDISLTNRPVDLVAENVDLALRGGDPGGAGLIARKVGMVAFGLFASPDYLERHGRPDSIEDLAGHDLLLFRSPSQSRVLRRADPRAGGEPRLASDNLALLKRLALRGAGIAALPDVLATRELASGQLERVVAGWSGEPSPLHLVFPSRRDMSPRVKAFADHLVRAMTDRPLDGT